LKIGDDDWKLNAQSAACIKNYERYVNRAANAV